MDLDTLRQIDSLASLSPYQLAQVGRRLVWRRYDPDELILHHQAHIHLNGLVYRGKVQIAIVQKGRRQVVDHVLAREPINSECWTRYTLPIELRAVEPTILCFLPLDGLQPAAFLERRTQQSACSSASIPLSTTSSINRTMFKILLLSTVLLLGLTAWYWQSPWRVPLSNLAYGLASYHLESSEYTKALSLLQTSVDLNPHLARAYNDMGYILYRQGRPKEAQAAFQRAVAADPTSAVAQSNLGLSYLEGGQLDLAHETLEQAVTLNPESMAAWTNLGMAEQLAGRPAEAIRAYRAALRLNPYNIVAQVNLGVLYYEQEQFSEARGYLTTALNMQPNLPHARAILGAIVLNEGDHALAWSEFQAVASDLADDPLLHFYLALWYEEVGMWERAEQELGRVLELQPHPDLAALAHSHLIALIASCQSLSAEETEKKGE